MKRTESLKKLVERHLLYAECFIDVVQVQRGRYEMQCVRNFMDNLDDLYRKLKMQIPDRR